MTTERDRKQAAWRGMRMDCMFCLDLPFLLVVVSEEPRATVVARPPLSLGFLILLGRFGIAPDGTLGKETG